MWKAKFKGTHRTCIIAPLCKKHKVTDYLYLLNAWIEDNHFYYSESHILQGEEKDKSNFIKDLGNLKETQKIEVSGNYIFTLMRGPKALSRYFPLWDKRIIQTKPAIQKSDGTEEWEIASWDKKPLVEILDSLANDNMELESITKAKIDNVFFPHIMPSLTSKQKDAIELAINEGYYEFPRKTNLDKLSKKQNISKPTFQQRIRIAEKKLVPFLTKNIAK